VDGEADPHLLRRRRGAVIPSLALEEPDASGWLNVNADTAAAAVAVHLRRRSWSC